MSTINQLNTIGTVSGGDLLPIYSTANSDTRKVSLTNFLEWLNEQETVAQSKEITQYAAPLTGATVVMNTSGNNVWLILTPAGTLSALTVLLPLNTTVADKTELWVNCTQIITTLTINGNGGAVIGAPTTIAANGYFHLKFDQVMQTWYRVS